MSTVSTAFPDQVYSSGNKPSADTLKADIQALETAHNELETRVVAASTSAAGTVELATTAETTTGTDTTRAVTPDALHDMTSLSGAAWFLDEDTMSSDSATKVPSQQSVKAYVDRPLISTLNRIPLYAPQGFLINGKIEVTDAAGITVAIKTLAGTDPSASDPVYVRIGDTVRTISAALSVSKADGTNWCNAGSAELATKEIDYFVYLGYNATDGVVLGFSRFPGANQYSDFSATTTNEKYCAISTITNAAATDYYENVGRFAATLSAGAGYTWSVPTYTAANLIQRPIYETRATDAIAPVLSNLSGTCNAIYKLVGSTVHYRGHILVSAAGGGAVVSFSCPFTAKQWTGTVDSHGAGRWLDAATAHYSLTCEVQDGSSVVQFMIAQAGQGNFVLGNNAGLGNADTIDFSIIYEI